MSAFSNYPLEGDGVIENLFYYLWCKDELDNGPKIRIPDTVIYKYRQPAVWYFTSLSGQIKKKSKYNRRSFATSRRGPRRILFLAAN